MEHIVAVNLLDEFPVPMQLALRLPVKAMALTDDIVELWESVSGGLLIEGYGMTESSPIALGNSFWPTRRTGTIGVPFPSTRMRVVDPENPGLEGVIRRVPGIDDVAVVGHRRPDGGEVVVAVVQADTVDEAGVRERCREELSAYKVPRRVLKPDGELPKSMLGKVLRKRVRDNLPDDLA